MTIMHIDTSIHNMKWIINDYRNCIVKIIHARLLSDIKTIFFCEFNSSWVRIPSSRGCFSLHSCTKFFILRSTLLLGQNWYLELSTTDDASVGDKTLAIALAALAKASLSDSFFWRLGTGPVIMGTWGDSSKSSWVLAIIMRAQLTKEESSRGSYRSVILQEVWED